MGKSNKKIRFSCSIIFLVGLSFLCLCCNLLVDADKDTSSADITPPSNITDLKFTVSYNSITFSFTEPEDEDYSLTIVDYQIKDSSSKTECVLKKGTSSRTFENLEYKTEYTFTFTTQDKSGNRNPSPVTCTLTTGSKAKNRPSISVVTEIKEGNGSKDNPIVVKQGDSIQLKLSSSKNKVTCSSSVMSFDETTQILTFNSWNTKSQTYIYSTDTSLKQRSDFIYFKIYADLKRIELTGSTSKLIPGSTDSVKLTASYYDCDEVLTTKDFLYDTPVWSSSDPAVAVVSNGIVTAAGAGTVEITLTCGQIKGSYEITVEEAQKEPDEETGDESGSVKIYIY